MVLNSEHDLTHANGRGNGGGVNRIELFSQQSDLKAEREKALRSENKNKIAVLKQRFLEGAKVTNWEKGYILAPEFNLVIDPDVLMACSEVWFDHYKGIGVDYVVGLPAAGDRLTPALAILLRAKLLPARKTDAVPGSWQNVLEYQNESFTTGVMGAKSKVGFVGPELKGKKILAVDDVIAFGNTGVAAIRAFQEAGAEVVGLAAMFAKTWQGGQDRIKQQTGVDAFSIINIKALSKQNGIELE